MLATADINALKLALQKQRLADMLVDELDFLGHIPRSDSPKVQAYLIQQGSTLSEAAQRLVREPDNDAIREELCSPHVSVARGLRGSKLEPLATGKPQGSSLLVNPMCLFFFHSTEIFRI